MLATIRSRMNRKIAVLALFAVLAVGLGSCASNKQTAFLSDPSDKKETALPWNEQQKWEQAGQAAMLNQQRR